MWPRPPGPSKRSFSFWRADQALPKGATVEDALHRQWHRLGLRGIAAILFGAFAFIWPSGTLQVLFLVFGAYLWVDGVLTISMAVRVHPHRETWLWLVEGFLGLVAGFAALILTPLDPVIIGYWLAVWAIATGLLELALAYRMRHFVFSGPYWALGAIISLVLGVLLFAMPVPIGTTLVLLLGLYAEVFGFAMLAIAWALRRIERHLPPPLPGAAGAA